MTPEAKARMLRAFHAFSLRIQDQYQLAYDALEEGDYQGASNILSRLATSHAKTSMSLRNKLMREGFLPEEEK